jgi:predicted nucleic acid-binding protein
MYLVDTNIWLERLLDQERSAEVARFLVLVPTDQLCMSDFSLHSIGVILHRLGRSSVLLDFTDKE